ncbi:BCCT family transporter [Pseudovibrio ascidiaceicola]|uniref:BCCT family transporter n=1 Tax=Pseudovibrio ascidiaceicola TaxID=285279 RepID=UPI003D36D719
MLSGVVLGIGLLTYATGAPLYHLQYSPDIIQSGNEANKLETVPPAMKRTFFHCGLSAWGCYTLCGLTLAFFAYRRGLPLTIRSTLPRGFDMELNNWLQTCIGSVSEHS